MTIPLTRPLWSQIFAGANIVIWLVTMAFTAARLGVAAASSASVPSEVLVTFGAKVNPLIAQGQFWRLVTANFLHVSLLHLAFNTYALWHLGPEVEALFGRSRFVALYLLTGVFGATASYGLGRYLSAGASGAIFGLVGALIAYFIRHRALFGARGRAYLSNMLVIVVINLVIGVTAPGIDNWGHLGGLISGFLMAFPLVPKYDFERPTWKGDHWELEAQRSPRRLVIVVILALLVLGLLVGGFTAMQRHSLVSYLFQAQQALDENDLPRAEKLLEEAAERYPQNADVQLTLALVYDAQGKTDAAIDALRRYVNLAPPGDERADRARTWLMELDSAERAPGSAAD
ncbi:MAG: hypothetical protein Kow0047_32890 [Anaerolineae bacterium]